MIRLQAATSAIVPRLHAGHVSAEDGGEVASEGLIGNDDHPLFRGRLTPDLQGSVETGSIPSTLQCTRRHGEISMMSENKVRRSVV